MGEEKNQMESPWEVSFPLYRYRAEKIVRRFVPIPCESSRAGYCLSQSRAATRSFSLTAGVLHMPWGALDMAAALNLCTGCRCVEVSTSWVPDGDGRAQQLTYTDFEEV